MQSFNHISPILGEQLLQKNISEPTKVQQAIIPLILEGKNTAFQSETGTGKTFAYLLPLIMRLLKKKEEQASHSTIIICAPTHELASQIKTQADFLFEAEELYPKRKLKTALLIGGSSLKRQLEKLKEKPDVIVGGPARLLELIHLKKLKSHEAIALVLDEADKLYSPELRDYTTDLQTILCEHAQLIACSATVKERLLQLLPKDTQFVALPKEDILTQKIEHWAIHAERRDKIDRLRSLLNAEKPAKALIFSAETGQIANIAERLQYKGITCATLHSKIDKVERKKMIDSFRSGKHTLLVTSDLSARGLDFVDVTHVIQMDIVEHEDFFVHRAGRTGRAGRKGINILIGDEWELRRLSKLEKKLGITIYPKVLYNSKVMPADMDAE